MTNFLKRIKKMGPKNAFRLFSIRVGKKFLHLVYAPVWYMFKLRNLGITHTDTSMESMDAGNSKESSIRQVLAGMPHGTFLEIGIGEFPHFERLKLIDEHGISYTGCDFASVCGSHKTELAIKDFDMKNIHFAANTAGTYSWTLFEMLERGEQFDAIYVDGHHTFYIDLPAILLADKLLKPGGYLLLDDIPWSLSFLKARMMKSISQWYFYHKIYNFSDYEKGQQSLCHIKMIAEELLIKRGEYSKEASLSSPHWWALRKKPE